MYMYNVSLCIIHATLGIVYVTWRIVQASSKLKILLSLKTRAVARKLQKQAVTLMLRETINNNNNEFFICL